MHVPPATKDSPSGPTDVDPKSEGALPESTRFTSGNFVKEYLLDTAAADAKFKGKTVEVTGVVMTFGTNEDDVAYINVQGTGGADNGGTPIQWNYLGDGLEGAPRT